MGAVGDRETAGRTAGLPDESIAPSLHGLLDRATVAASERVAISDSRRSWTYGELRWQSRSVAAWLVANGIRRGDRVLVEAGADARVAAIFYGCSLTGAVFVPLPVGAADHRRQQIIDDAEPALMISASTGWVGSTSFDVVCGLTERPQRDMEPSDDVLPESDPRDIAVLLYTSGSTAQPKGVICPQSAMVFAAWAIQARLRYRPDDVVYCRLPLSFDYGLYQLLLAALVQAQVVLADNDSGPDLLGAIRRSGATVVPVVPSIAALLLRLATRDPRPCRVRLFTNTGEDLPTNMVGDLRGRFPGASVQLMFGITECKRVSVEEPDSDLIRPGSVGRPLDGTMVRIVDDAGFEMANHQYGQITVAGPHVMDGYWRSAGLSAEVFRRDAAGRVWLFTGDYGHLDADGHLYFHGRRDQVFKRHGVRTSVVEIEAAVLRIPEVAEAGLVPPRGPSDMVLFVVTSLTSAEVVQRLRALLEAARLPTICRRLDQLPRGSNGKIDRSALAALTLRGDS